MAIHNMTSPTHFMIAENLKRSAGIPTSEQGIFCLGRRELMAGLVWAFAPSPVFAKSDVSVRRIAIYSPATPNALMHDGSPNSRWKTFFAELWRLGYVEGQNLKIERYGKEQSFIESGRLVAEVISGNPDVIFIGGPGSILFKKATDRIPLVAFTSFPIEQGLIQNLARPGGNITGVSTDAGPSILGKRIQLLREIFPAMSKLAFLQQNGSIQSPVLQAASDALGIPSMSLFVDPNDEAAFREAIGQARESANAILVAENAGMIQNRALIAKLIEEVKLPAMYSFADAVNVGGLMAYSADLEELTKQAVNQIDAIFKGLSPANIPFFQSSRFELSINLKTAKTLGLTVPAALLATADRVVE